MRTVARNNNLSGFPIFMPLASLFVVIGQATLSFLGAMLIPRATLGVVADSTCSIRVRHSNRVELPDATIPALDASSASWNRGRLLIAGTPVVGFRLHESHPPSALSPQAVGIVRQGDGTWAWLPTPDSTRSFSSPRAVATGEDRWSVLMVTGKPSDREPQRYERAVLWLGIFDRDRWTSLDSIGVFQGAYLGLDRPSDLVANGDELGFAFAHDRSIERESNSRGNQGALLLRVRGHAVRVDSLHTWAAPTYVRLAGFPDEQSWTLVTTEPTFDAGRAWPSALFVTEFRTQWRLRRRIVADSARSVTSPQTAQAGADLAIGWTMTGASTEPSFVELRHAILRRDGKVTPGPSNRIAGTANGALLFARGADLIAWLVPRRERRDFDAIVVSGSEAPIVRRARLGVAIDNFRPVLASANDTTVVLVTGAVERRPGAMIGQTLITRTTIRCNAQ